MLQNSELIYYEQLTKVNCEVLFHHFLALNLLRVSKLIPR